VAIERGLKDWCGAAALRDDVSVLLIEREGRTDESH
jgi:hypothetical protein